MIADVDRDGSGEIEYAEFEALCTTKMSQRDSKEEIAKAFKLMDGDNDGLITFADLRRVAKELGEQLTDEELGEMIDEASGGGAGEGVSLQDFERIMKKTSLFG